MKVNMIFARSRNGVIGADNALPWHSPTDMKRFRELTVGGCVVMGGKTWDSLPDRLRPLPYRTNVVLTSRPPKCRSLDGACSTAKFDAILPWCELTMQPIWIIGGASIYKQFLEAGLVTDIYETVIGADFEGDAYAPDIPPEFNIVSSSTTPAWVEPFSLTFNHFAKS